MLSHYFSFLTQRNEDYAHTAKLCLCIVYVCVCGSVVTIAYLSFSFSIWKQEFMMPHQLHDNVMLIENNQNNAQRII